MNIHDIYHERCRMQTDINEHLPTLFRYAKRCEHVTEFGIRDGHSTHALLAGLDEQKGTLISYDIMPIRFEKPICNAEWIPIVRDTKDIDLFVFTDLLFVDSNHKYPHVRMELFNYQKFIRRWIIMHDTDPQRDIRYGDGVCKAMNEFLEAHEGWYIKERFENNNGLTVLERR